MLILNPFSHYFGLGPPPVGDSPDDFGPLVATARVCLRYALGQFLYWVNLWILRLVFLLFFILFMLEFEQVGPGIAVVLVQVHRLVEELASLLMSPLLPEYLADLQEHPRGPLACMVCLVLALFVAVSNWVHSHLLQSILSLRFTRRAWFEAKGHRPQPAALWVLLQGLRAQILCDLCVVRQDLKIDGLVPQLWRHRIIRQLQTCFLEVRPRLRVLSLLDLEVGGADPKAQALLELSDLQSFFIVLSCFSSLS